MTDGKQVATVSERIRNAMDLRGMRQVELVEKSGLSKSLVNQYVSGKIQNAKTDKIYVLAQALQVDPIWLMGFDVPMEKKPMFANADKLASITKEPQIVEYAWKIMQLDDAQKNIIYGMIDQMIK